MSAPGGAVYVKGVSKRFGSTQALDDVSLALERGKVHALVGGNGSGKSTLIKILAGVLQADAGTVEVDGLPREARSLSPAVAWEAGFRFVHQQSSTFPDLTVAENLAIGRGFRLGRLRNISWRRQHQLAAARLAKFHIECRPEQPLSELSPAKQCLVAIARALDQETGEVAPRVLVLDEPTASLPAVEVDHLIAALRRYAAAGQSILYVSHRLDEVLSVADTVSVLSDGHLAETCPREGLTRQRLGDLIAGRALAEATTGRSAQRATTVLEATNLRGGAVRGASFTVHEGEILGIGGLLGSGRSTLLRLLFGLQDIEHGELRLFGKPVRFASTQKAMAAGLAYVPEDRSREAAFASLSVRENLLIATVPRYWRRARLSSRAERTGAARMKESYMVRAASLDAPLSSLSGGNQQKVMLARWLCRDPRLMLLDEPTQGVDVGARAEIFEVVRAAIANGAAAIVVSSDVDELELLCDRVIVMAEGRTTATVNTSVESVEELEQLVASAETR